MLILLTDRTDTALVIGEKLARILNGHCYDLTDKILRGAKQAGKDSISRVLYHTLCDCLDHAEKNFSVLVCAEEISLYKPCRELIRAAGTVIWLSAPEENSTSSSADLRHITSHCRSLCNYRMTLGTPDVCVERIRVLLEDAGLLKN